jgi:nitrite reductase/ring-hydroxylating ferredoxin subunit
MTSAPKQWIDLGDTDKLKDPPRRIVTVANKPVALTYANGRFGAVSGVCNHAGGPLSEGELDGEYLTCPWHYWKFHFATGEGEPGFEEDRIPSYALEERDGRLMISAEPVTRRHRKPHEPHPLARAVKREPGPVRVAGISTTVMTRKHPRSRTRRSTGPKRGSSSSTNCVLEPARVSTRRPRARARGRAASRRWTRRTSSIASTTRSCTGPTSC